MHKHTKTKQNKTKQKRKPRIEIGTDLFSNQFRVVVLEYGEGALGDMAALDEARGAMEVQNLQDRMGAARPEVQRADPLLHYPDSPPQEALEPRLIPKRLLIQLLILEHAIAVVAHRVPLPVESMHIRH